MCQIHKEPTSLRDYIEIVAWVDVGGWVGGWGEDPGREGRISQSPKLGGGEIYV